MLGLLEEILEIPERAEECYENNRSLTLPRRVPYLGMGSSYLAALTLYYAGADIIPDIASEYYHYRPKKTLGEAVLISQSGESSETLWALARFRKVIAVTNNPNSKLARSDKTKKIIDIRAGKEEYFSSTKTYINTLITLYLGLGINPRPGILALKRQFKSYANIGKRHAHEISKRLAFHRVKGLYIVGSGPNAASAYEGALVLSETTKLSWIGMPLAQYDHGPKEAARDTIVIFLNGGGKDKKRQEQVRRTIARKSNALILEIGSKTIPEAVSPLPIMSQIFFLTNALADYLKIKSTFHIGSKITTVPNSVK